MYLNILPHVHILTLISTKFDSNGKCQIDWLFALTIGRNHIAKMNYEFRPQKCTRLTPNFGG